MSPPSPPAERGSDALAIFGAPPAFPEPLHVGRPNIGDKRRLFERLEAMIDSRRLTNHGPFVREFEERLAAYLGVKHCIALCNATVGLEIVTRALGMSGEVIVPSMTFIATAHALDWQAVTPIFCDVDARTHNLDPARIEALITPRTTGILGVHLWGRPCDTEALTEIAKRHRLKLVFDAAHAFGCTHRGRMIGGFGDAEVFSFHATKVLNAFEGGAITTNDDGLAEKVRLMQNFGFRGFDNVIHPGTNGKMTEASAAMGLTSLESFGSFVECNRANYVLYREKLAAVPGLRAVAYDEKELGNYQYVVVEVDETETSLSRDHLVRVLQAENVLARRYFYPGCHRMEPYRTRYPELAGRLSATERLCGSVLVLPTGTSVGAEEVSRVCAIIAEAVRRGPTITRHLAERP